MPAPEQIRIFIQDYLTEVPSRSNGDEIAVVCTQPGCGDVSGNRSINLRTGLTSCWRCNVGGPIGWWARKMGFPVDFNDYSPGAIKIDELSEVIAGLEKVGEVVKPSGYVPSVELPRGFTRIADEPDCAYSRLITKMAVRKRLDFETLARAGVGFTRTTRKWEPYAIFPVFEWGRPVYYQGRTYTDRPGESTKLFPNRQECPLSSRYWLYNIDRVAERGGIIILVEAIMNVLSLEREFERRGITDPITPIAVFKHKLSGTQREKLLSAMRRAKAGGRPVREICAMYDGRTEDEVKKGKAGEAAHMARQDVSAFGRVPVSVVDLPDLVDPNDDASCAVDYFLERKPYSRLSSIVV